MATLEFEQPLLEQGYSAVAGLDEAGRGALAGPVSAGAVILPLRDAHALDLLREVNDSKQLTAGQRDRFFDLIVTHAASWGVGFASAAEIDEHGIIPATKLAMRRALAELHLSADYLLIDGRIRLSSINLPQQSLIRGDSRSLSIAAASILAKVSRDRQMIAYHEAYPDYGFADHKGYGTASHRAMLVELGPISIHRRSFAPIRKSLVEAN